MRGNFTAGAGNSQEVAVRTDVDITRGKMGVPPLPGLDLHCAGAFPPLHGGLRYFVPSGLDVTDYGAIPIVGIALALPALNWKSPHIGI